MRKLLMVAVLGLAGCAGMRERVAAAYARQQADADGQAALSAGAATLVTPTGF